MLFGRLLSWSAFYFRPIAPMDQFSEGLKAKLIKYFWKYYGIRLTGEKAERYLDSLADLYLSYYRIKEKPKRKGVKWH